MQAVGRYGVRARRQLRDRISAIRSLSEKQHPLPQKALSPGRFRVCRHENETLVFAVLCRRQGGGRSVS